MTTVIESFVAELGWREKGANVYAQHKKQSADLVKTLSKVSAIYTAVAGVVTGFVAKVNAETASTYRLSKALGTSFEWLNTWGKGTKSVGIGTEGLSNSMGFLQKQIGLLEMKGNLEGGTVAKSIEAIGLSVDKVRNAKPEEQFNMIANALGNTENRAIQFAAASQLFGRMGGQSFARLANIAKSEGKSVSDYVNRFSDLEFETERSARGAASFTAGIGALKFAFDSLKAAIAGYIGEALTPMLKDLKTWIKNNKELIKTKIVEWARSLVSWLKSTYTIIYKVASALSVLLSAVGGVSGALKILLAAFIGLKLARWGSDIGNVTLSFKGLKSALEGGASGGLVGILGTIAAFSFSDLMQSLDDISNESYGNRLARLLLRTQDKLTVAFAEFMGAQFKNDAERATYLAKVQTRINNMIESSINQMIEAPGKLLDKFTGFFESVHTKIRQMARYFYEAVANNPLINFLIKGMSGTNIQGAKSYISNALGNAPSAAPYVDYGPVAPVRAPANVTTQKSSQYFNNVSAPITINAAPGTNEQEIGRQVEKHLDRAFKRAQRSMVTGE